MAVVCEPEVLTEAGIREESTGSERRRAERFRCNWYPSVRVLARAANLHMHRALVKDVSENGIGLIVERAFVKGTILAIQLRKAEAGFSGILSAIVQHTSVTDEGYCVVGCRLSRSLTGEEMNALL